mgnify:CR=1 FL=1
MKKLTKTDFISYRECRKNVWVKWHRKDIYDKCELSEFEQSLLATGNEVEEHARKMFPGGYTVEKRSEGAEELTKKLMAERTPVIFQAVFSTAQYLAAADVLKWDPQAGAYNLYEVKMSSTEEEDDDGNVKVDKKKELQFEYDLAFQVNVAEACSLAFNRKFLIRLNKKYVRQGDLDYAPNQLFIIEDKTEAVNKLKSFAATEMESAAIYLSEEKETAPYCECYYKGRSSHCTTFAFNNREKNIPAYSVHDLNRIGNSKAYLKELLDEGVLHIKDVPEDDRLMPKKGKDGMPGKPRKLNQVRVHKTQVPIIDHGSIKAELGLLRFPLYFLDYETYPTAIPIFIGYHPYQHIVFQYSLHVLRSKDAELEHYECLIFDGDPAERISASLRKNIGDTGTVISWYKKFENARNKELGHLLPDYREFFDDVISRTYDLMDIVENQHYVHPEFYGKSSIKKVLPALIKDAELSYGSLGVKNGTEAIEAYRQITSGELPPEAAKAKELEMLKYCRLDTYAMYKLWRFFDSISVE